MQCRYSIPCRSATSGPHCDCHKNHELYSCLAIHQLEQIVVRKGPVYSFCATRIFIPNLAYKFYSLHVLVLYFAALDRLDEMCADFYSDHLISL